MNQDYRILQIDPYLSPFAGDIELRMNCYKKARRKLVEDDKMLSSFVNGHLYFGFHEKDNGWVYREWAPNAQDIYLIGDFNNWNDQVHKLKRLDNGVWELLVEGELPHGSRVKLKIKANNHIYDRIPLYCKRIVQNSESNQFDGMIWNPPVPFNWNDKGFVPQQPLYIYECHIGMSGEKESVSSFLEFADNVLPRIKKQGYTAIQIMAIMEHPYYGSFGYQVSNFFAVSSRFGTPEDFKALVDKAHSVGIAVIMDLVHSHTVKNTVEGLAEFDGTDYQFCHHGNKGDHPDWHTRLFNYGKLEVQHFLLSNIKYWLTEYHLDGFRFDGVTSMMYHHHGRGTAFDNYKKYFSMDTDLESITYLQLATELAKEVNPNSILIAEDMSGMPGMCLPITDGGIGFDYRLGMGLPDLLIKMMRTKDENWHMGEFWHELTNRRPQEKVIGYTESHDQALVGDKTLMFWLADQDMYWNMNKDGKNERIDRAITLHKILRFITCAVGGDGYLNFMGNEFGHPEWIDFPREGNGWSYKYARRQWSLVDNPNLKYEYLYNFDAAMLSFLTSNDLYKEPARLLLVHESNKVLAFIKGNYTFIFNFHPSNSYVHMLGDTSAFKLVFHSARQCFGGFVDEVLNTGLLCKDGVVIDRRTAVVLKYTPSK
ncbi:alpha-amylase family glycosyl hydrolase [Pseudobacteroides cellulosolvens]|uniref:1,4-alpha-glucan branching enzyme n=1 Tax=Pseudobacteroides cellulosolvens ATCC 35603 = DSM 2933 TaxID=398512 RepID=A0A0L6JPJ2_9FIRM|nr:alpha-amylase family glycosyl hydrolase [Pseudobacteroides cellulosolvens]KNY27640.1 1,4-alpha-glucan branching enzyme [Pseudobacteroides cellulosolvens ATCC 35603 = DSM 2933]